MTEHLVHFQYDTLGGIHMGAIRIYAESHDLACICARWMLHPSARIVGTSTQVSPGPTGMQSDPPMKEKANE